MWFHTILNSLKRDRSQAPPTVPARGGSAKDSPIFTRNAGRPVHDGGQALG